MLSNLLIAIFAVSVVAASQEWNVNATDGTTCIIVKADPTLTLNFKDGNQTYTYEVPINNTLTMSGDCNMTATGVPQQRLQVQFIPTSTVQVTPWILELIFKKLENGFELADYNITTNSVDGWNGTKTGLVFSKDGNSTDVTVHDAKDAFKCSSTPLGLNSKSHLDMKNFHALAFASEKQPTFPTSQVYEMCKADAQTSDIVPIIVGACLAGLVVIVLVAYLIGRARARRQGYASV